MKFECFLSLPLLFSLVTSEKSELNKQCRPLLACTVKSNCINLRWLQDKIKGEPIGPQLYNYFDKATDYGCIFATSCTNECEQCPLCLHARTYLAEVLAATPFTNETDCPDLFKCASACVANVGADLAQVNYCMRHTCAYSCFDGACPKCSAFVTRLFNQSCVSGDVRSLLNYKGQCFELFRDMVYERFKPQFDQHNLRPAIG